MSKKSKFFRVAREGDTCDGRKIERSWIAQAAASFNREKYGARVWLEHMRGYLPDSPFKAYGDVLALKAEEVQFDDGKKLCLFAQIEPTADLIALNRQRQKLYTSCEFDPNFANSGQAYLVGLAVTDSPASLGTEMLTFAASAQTNPLSTRKQDPANVFSEALEVVLEFEDEAEPPVAQGLLAKVKELLSLPREKADAGQFAELAGAVEAIAQAQREVLQKLALLEGREKNFVRTEEFSALKESLAATRDATPDRPSATGAAEGAATDC